MRFACCGRNLITERNRILYQIESYLFTISANVLVFSSSRLAVH